MFPTVSYPLTKQLAWITQKLDGLSRELCIQCACDGRSEQWSMRRLLAVRRRRVCSCLHAHVSHPHLFNFSCTTNDLRSALFELRQIRDRIFTNSHRCLTHRFYRLPSSVVMDNPSICATSPHRLEERRI